jgi:alkylhydroperoxidase/carboxymuconolactone decarboxylase family protein YurZ
MRWRKKMSESQIERDKNRRTQFEKILAQMPEVGKHVGAMEEAAYKDGALDGKTKRLMALAIALEVGYENCTLGQANFAIDLGVTKDEILETLGVVISVRGTTGIAESLKIIQMLDEMGKL